MFDVSGLTEVKMNKRNGWQGSYYVDGDGVCAAKTCATCHDICPSSVFARSSCAKYNLQSHCRECSRIRMQEKRNTMVEGARLGYTMSRESANKYKNRTEDEVSAARLRLWPNGSKRCITCSNILPFDSFHTARSRADGLRNMCKICAYISNKEYSDRTDVNGVRFGTLVQRRNTERLISRTPYEVQLDTLRLVPCGHKPCNSCGEIKILDDYYRSKWYPDGYTRDCKTCDGARRKNLREKGYMDYWVSSGIPLMCYVCGEPWGHSDHVIPKKLGGVDDPCNRLPMCEEHNLAKGKLPLRTWLLENHPDKYVEVIHRVTVEYGMDIDPIPPRP